MILEYQTQLASRLRDAVRARFSAEIQGVAFQYPPTTALGDLASAAPFELAKTLKRNPREIAQRLAEDLASAPGVRRADVAGGGYINVFLDRAAFARRLSEALREAKPAPPVPGLVIVEHTSINPNKAAHIGHLRNAVLGDTFVRILRSGGHNVTVQNYIDDTGVQVADVVVGFQRLEGKSLDDVRKIEGRFDYYCWDLYARVGDFYTADPENKALQIETLHAIEAGDNDTARLADHVARRIVDCHLATMARLDIRYDLLAHESDILRLHFWDRAFELLKEAGAVRLETEGRAKGCWVLGMESGADNDEDKILVRSNGTVTYTGKDIAYQLWKLGILDRDFHYRKTRTTGGAVLWSTAAAAGESDVPAFGHARAVYNVIDVGQSYPQRVVKAGVAALGQEASERSYHLSYEKVVLSPSTARDLGYEVSLDQAAVKVSGRKGQGVKADDLIDALERKALAEIDARSDPTREAEEKRQSAHAIAVGALRYFLLKYGRTKIITFDMDEALAFVGETGPYLQNSVVRAKSILAKLEGAGHRLAELRARVSEADWATFLATGEGDEVWGLLTLIGRTDDVCEQAIRSQEVALLTKHAFAIAQAFHGYYQQPAYSVLYAETDALRAIRSTVVELFVTQMEIALGLLGIPIPERM